MKICWGREKEGKRERERVREREKHSSLNRSSIFEMVPAGVWKVWYINLNSNQAGLTRVFSWIRGRGIGVTFRLYIFFMFKNIIWIHLFFSGLRPNYTIHNCLTLIRNIEPYFISNPLRKYLPPPSPKGFWHRSWILLELQPVLLVWISTDPGKV